LRSRSRRASAIGHEADPACGVAAAQRVGAADIRAAQWVVIGVMEGLGVRALYSQSMRLKITASPTPVNTIKNSAQPYPHGRSSSGM